VIVGVGVVTALAVAITLLAVLVPKHQEKHQTHAVSVQLPVQASLNETEQPYVEGPQQQSSTSSSSSSDAGDSGGGDSGGGEVDSADSSSSSSSTGEEEVEDGRSGAGSSTEEKSAPMQYQFTPPGGGYVHTPPGENTSTKILITHSTHNHCSRRIPCTLIVNALSYTLWVRESCIMTMLTSIADTLHHALHVRRPMCTESISSDFVPIPAYSTVNNIVKCPAGDSRQEDTAWR
jgi:hypothetical protein